MSKDFFLVVDEPDNLTQTFPHFPNLFEHSTSDLWSWNTTNF